MEIQPQRGRTPASVPISCSVHKAALAAVIVLCTFAAYTPALSAAFIWDDSPVITDNPLLGSTDGLRRIWFELGAMLQYYPLVHTSFWLEHRWFGFDPFVYHFDNVALHALNGVLAWRLFERIGIRGAWLAGLIFAVHPVHVESVAWVSERKNVLSGAFYLLAALAWFRFSPLGGSTSQRREWRWYGLASLCFLLALLSKTVTASLPAALLLIGYWRRGNLCLRECTPLLPWFILATGFGLLTGSMEREFVGAHGEDWALGFVARILVAGRAVLFYLSKLALPIDLSFVYPRWSVSTDVTTQFLYPAAAAGIVVALWLMRERLGRGPLVASLFFGGTLFPALGFINLYPHRFSFVADHFQYLASLGPIVLAASAIAHHAVAKPGVSQPPRQFGQDSVPVDRSDRPTGSMRPNTPAFVATALLIATLALLAFSRAQVFQSSEHVWIDTLGKNPDSFLAHSNLGRIRLEQGELASAIEHFRRAVRIKPTDAINLNNLAWGLATAPSVELRNGPEAVKLARRAVEATGRRSADLLETLAAAYAENGQFIAAVRTTRRALAVAEATGQATLHATLENQLRLYLANKPYHLDTSLEKER